MILYWVSALLIVLPGISFSAEQEGLNVVLVMDSSGSMRRNDPQDLRKPASKMLISLLGAGDRASIVSFSDQGYPIVPLLPVKGEKNQQRLFAAVGKVSSRGSYTNIQKGVEAAMEVIDKSHTTAKSIIVLMSDGQMAPGSAELAREYTNKLFNETGPELIKRKIEVHSIAFTDESDRVLMERLSYMTGGKFNVAKQDKDLHKVFSDIFEQNKSPDMVPFKGGKFSVDKSVNEVTILGSKSGEHVALALQSPSGKQMTSAKHPAEVKWLASTLFDLITIPKPEAGEWILQSSDNDNKAYILTDLKLLVTPSTRTASAEQVIDVAAWLEESGKLMDKQPVLSTLKVSLSVQSIDGSWHEAPIQPETSEMQMQTGRYNARIALPGPGNYHIRVVASTPTFSREKTLVIDIPSPEVVAAVHPSAVKPAAPAVKKPAPAKHSTEKKTPQPEDDQLSLSMLLGIFLGFNLLLGVVVAVVILIKKRRRNKEAVA